MNNRDIIPSLVKTKHQCFPLIGLKSSTETFIDENNNIRQVSIIDLKDIHIKKICNKENYVLLRLFVNEKKPNNLNKSILYNYRIGEKYFKYAKNFWIIDEVLKDLNFDNELLSKESLDSILKKNIKLTIKGVSKSKGFCGVMKKHNFDGGPASHGSSLFHRGPGSVGQDTPSRILPGSKLPGRHGGKQTTIKTAQILNIIDNKLYVEGSLPGKKNNLLTIFISNFKKK